MEKSNVTISLSYMHLKQLYSILRYASHRYAESDRKDPRTEIAIVELLSLIRNKL
jgi:hypothetical protein